MLGEYVGTGVTVLISLGTGLLTAGIAWGLLQGKIRSLEKDVIDMQDRLDHMNDRHERFPEQYVTMQHFRAITYPLQENIREIQHDIKQILVILSKNETSPRRTKPPSES